VRFELISIVEGFVEGLGLKMGVHYLERNRGRYY
jgi:hypothetical protein